MPLLRHGVDALRIDRGLANVFRVSRQAGPVIARCEAVGLVARAAKTGCSPNRAFDITPDSL